MFSDTPKMTIFNSILFFDSYIKNRHLRGVKAKEVFPIIHVMSDVVNGMPSHKKKEKNIAITLQVYIPAKLTPLFRGKLPPSIRGLLVEV